MTVKELISKLESMPQDAEVAFRAPEGYDWLVTDMHIDGGAHGGPYIMLTTEGCE